MGFDIKLSDMSDNDLAYCKEAVKNYRRLSPVIMDGNMYRLYSPYEGPHAVTQFVGTDQKSSVVFAFNTYPRWGERNNPVLLKGLNPETRYRVREINMWPGANSSLGCNDRVYSGQYLMNVGLSLLNTRKLTSYVLEITAE